MLDLEEGWQTLRTATVFQIKHFAQDQICLYFSLPKLSTCLNNKTVLAKKSKTKKVLATTPSMECKPEEKQSYLDWARERCGHKLEFQEGELGKRWAMCCRVEVIWLSMVCLGKRKGELAKKFQGTTGQSWEHQGCWALIIFTKWGILRRKDVKRMGET